MPSASLPAERPHAWRIAGLAASAVVFSSPTLSQQWRGAPLPFVPVTIVFALVLILIVVTWRVRHGSTPTSVTLRSGAAAIAALVVVALLTLAARRLVDLILWNPYGSDMLLVTREAIRRLLRGHDPYGLYHVPWEAPLPYGPMLWSPFVVPEVLRVDLRAVTVIGELFVPACCGIAAVVEAGRGRLLAAIAWVVLLAIVVFNPDLAIFTTGGHTPSYWPLVPLFAAFVAAEYWSPAAFVLGLLVAGRSTLVSLVPIFAMAVWIADRRQTAKALGILTITLAALLLPFAFWDFQAFWYGMVASYPRVIKQVVWTSSDQGAIKTIGITGWLLSHHLERLVEVTQIGALAGVFALAWSALRRGAPPLPWMGLALATFSMTTLWPVFYIYFDVILLFVSAAIVETVGARRPRLQVAGWLTTLAALILLVSTMMWMGAPAYPRIDVGSAEGARALHRGFSPVQTDGARRFAWVRGLNATVILPRRSTAPADIVVTGAPVVRPGEPPQAITATLNGSLLGTVFAGAGWQPLRFRAARSAWRIGANELQLSCAFARLPVDVGLGSDRHEAALGVAEVDVAPEADERSRR